MFMAAPEPAPEMIFWSVGAESRSRLFLAALAASFGKEKTKALFLYRYVLSINSFQFIKINLIQTRGY